MDRDLAAKETSRVNKAQQLKDRQSNLRGGLPMHNKGRSPTRKQMISFTLYIYVYFFSPKKLNHPAYDWTPAAFLSVTAPRIAVDAVSDASTIFALGE